jgi:integrase
MSVFKRWKKARFYSYEFILESRRYRGSTKCTTLKAAERFEIRLKDQIALGNVGIVDRKPVPTLKEFLKSAFLPWVESTFVTPEDQEGKNKIATGQYYQFGAKKLMSQDSGIADLRLDEITSEHTAMLSALLRGKGLAGATVNQALRTLKRALNLAEKWKYLTTPALRFNLGEESKRDRILTSEEKTRYLDAATDPWLTIATLWLELGIRPGEIVRLTSEDLDWENMRLAVRHGKSKSAKRILPMVDAVYIRLKAWYESLGKPETGWLFPSPKNPDRHINKKRIHDFHKVTLKAAELPSDTKDPEYFVPYAMRHTCFTEMANEGIPITHIAAAAGHSSILITQRYTHPKEADIRSAFERKQGRPIGDAKRREILREVPAKIESPQKSPQVAEPIAKAL